MIINYSNIVSLL